LNAHPKDVFVLSPELAFVVKKIEASRSECLKSLWLYIVENDLQISSNRSLFQPDQTLEKIFGSAPVPVFAMSKHLSQHLY